MYEFKKHEFTSSATLHSDSEHILSNLTYFYETFKTD